MSETQFSATLALVRRAIDPTAESARSDGQLLASFVADGDPDAFALLVRRHEPMVLGVCRRITDHAHDAEDASQAVFLVLARRAATVNPPEAVGNWLYGVAVRTACEARAIAARRRTRETPTHPLPERGRPDPEPLAGDTRAALDEELARLPDKYRTLIVLCDLEGEAQAPLAHRFGLPLGTVYRRLATARALLRDRLRKRGLVPAVVLAAAAPGVSAATTRLAMVSAHPPPHVAKLAEVIMRNAVGWKWKLVPVVAFLAVVTGLVGIGLLAAQPTRPEVALALRGAPVSAPVPAAGPRTGEILVWKMGHAVLLRPDGTIAREWKGEQVPEACAARLSPDGRTIAVLRAFETRQIQFRGDFDWSLYNLTLYPVAEKLKGTDYKVPSGSAAFLAWSPDGTRLFVGTHDDDGTFQTYIKYKNITYCSVDVKTGKREPVKPLDGYNLQDVSADGKHFLAKGTDPKQPGACLFRIPADGGKVERLADDNPYEAVFSPDGKRVLMCGWTTPTAGVGGGPVAPLPPWFDTVTLADGKRTTTIPLDEGETALSCRFAPDGKRVVSLRKVLAKVGQPLPGRDVVVSNVDGTNRKTVLSIDGEDHSLRVLIDWR